MLKKVKQIVSENWGIIVNILVICFVVGYMLGYLFLMLFAYVNHDQVLEINTVDPVPFATLFALFFVFSYFREKLSDLERRIEKQKQYREENPTVSEFEQRFPAWYQQLFDQDPDAFIHRYCKECATELRVATNLITLEYDSTTAEPYKQKLHIFCPNECRVSDHSIILFNEKKKKRLQGEVLEVVNADDEEPSNQLPQKLESIG